MDEKEKSRVYQREYYLRNIEHKKKQKAERYQKRKEYIKKWSREKYAENKDFFKERNKKYAETVKARFGILTRRSKTRGHEVSLSLEEFTEIVSKPCKYCGGNDKIMGIDRRDNKLGYHLANSEPCCKTCNMMKHAMPLDKFLSHVSKIHNHLLEI